MRLSIQNGRWLTILWWALAVLGAVLLVFSLGDLAFGHGRSESCIAGFTILSLALFSVSSNASWSKWTLLASIVIGVLGVSFVIVFVHSPIQRFLGTAALMLLIVAGAIKAANTPKFNE